MGLFPRVRGTRRRLAGATIVVVLLSVVGATEGALATTENVEAWQKKLERVAQPSTTGCFTAVYPRLAWRETTCAPPPSAPMSPRPPGPAPLVIGNGYNVVAERPDGYTTPIFHSEGSFENVNNTVTRVTSPIERGGPPTADAYSIQLNTNHFTTDRCAGAATPDICRGWKQFVFANNGTTGVSYVEYWLLSYNQEECPAGWTTAPVEDSLDTDCYLKIDGAAIPSNTPIRELQRLKLVANFGVLDGVRHDVLTTHIGTTSQLVLHPMVLDAGDQWTQTEFNVFGYGHGHTAVFNQGASFDVRILINYGGRTAPKCVNTGYSRESNNLEFVGHRPAETQPGPAVIFHEEFSIRPGSTPCNTAVTVGDTHQHTFAGLLYDFQATGDFVEALVGNAFEVQTRKVSGAPSWPNASVNRSVAARMGTTRVAFCDGTRLMVDGRATDLPPDGSLRLPTGVEVRRVGSGYSVRDRSGNSVRVTPNTANAPTTSYTDVEIGIGTWPAPVRGLLGNPDNNPHQLEARDGTRFTMPISFNDLYGRFGPSWRVNATSSLLAPCGSAASGNPSAPFFAGDLNPTLRERARTTCLQSGVAQAWLGTCMLDVAVLGATAARFFVDRPAPVRDVNPPPPPPCSPTGGCRSAGSPPR